jgi:hypothetical protein
MGAGQSISKSLPSREKYKGQVIPVQDLVNTIFRWMMEQMDTNDLLKLANPKYCKDYVFLTKEVLDKFMRQIQLEPKLGAKNVLYFQSVKQLTFSDEATQKVLPAQKEYRDALCAQLAFFTVRLFQVFGALALTVIDSLPEATPSLIDIRAAAKQPLPFDRRPTLFGPATGGARQVTSQNMGNLEKLYIYAKPYFLNLESGQNVYAIVDPSNKPRDIKTTSVGVILYYPDEPYNLYYKKDSGNIIEANIEITNDSDASYTLSIKTILLNNNNLGISFNVPMTKKRSDFLYEDKGFFEVLQMLLSSVTRETTRGKSYDEILGVKKEGRVTERVDEAGIPEGLSYLKIKEYLKSKPKAYCVARAIQLLSPTIPQDGMKGIYESNVCYFDASEPYLKDSVPMYKQAITSNAPGIRALNQLFFDILKNNVPAMDKQTEPRYQEFVNIMQSIFSPKEPQTQVEKLEKVTSLPFEQCADKQNKRIILTTKNSIREVQKVVAELLTYQMVHTANVAKFMNRLFELDKQGKILGINRNVLKGGIPYINKVAEDARNLLTEYYKFCEGTYRLGALRVLGLNPSEVILQDKRAKV